MTDFFTEIANAKFETWWSDCGETIAADEGVRKEAAKQIFIEGVVAGPANREELQKTRNAWGDSSRNPQIQQGDCKLCDRTNQACLVFADNEEYSDEFVCAHCLQLALETSKAILLAEREPKL